LFPFLSFRKRLIQSWNSSFFFSFIYLSLNPFISITHLLSFIHSLQRLLALISLIDVISNFRKSLTDRNVSLLRSLYLLHLLLSLIHWLMPNILKTYTCNGLLVLYELLLLLIRLLIELCLLIVLRNWGLVTELVLMLLSRWVSLNCKLLGLLMLLRLFVLLRRRIGDLWLLS
jgi:hypothetical protein